MILKNMFQALTPLLLLGGVVVCFLSCSSDKPEPGCFQDEGRKIIASITEETGTIREPGKFCPSIFTLEPENKTESGPLGVYAPCNLDPEYKTDGIQVIYTGYVYESFETEDICADFFEITEIRVLNP